MKTLQKINDRRVTRSVSLRNGRGNSLPIPIELIVLIFSRLDLKSVARCRCVSKLWASVLRSSDFTELFLSRSCSSSPKLLLAYHKEGKLFFLSSPQPQNSSPIVFNSLMTFPFHGGFYVDCQNMDLVHGLVRLNYKLVVNAKVKILLKICNPSTGEVLILPNAKKSNRNRVWSLLGYDPIAKQFKILSMVHPETDDAVCGKYQVLTIGRTQNMSWKMIECDVPHHPPHKKICINGILYYTSIDSDAKTCMVVCFDVRLEKFIFIKTTGILKEALLDRTIVPINYNGKLGLLLSGIDITTMFFFRTSIQIKFWVLEDLEKQEWSYHTLVFPIVPNNGAKKVTLDFVGMTKENEIVLLSDYRESVPFYLFYLNLEKKTLVRSEIQGMDTYGINRIFLNHVDNVTLYGSV